MKPRHRTGLLCAAAIAVPGLVLAGPAAPVRAASQPASKTTVTYGGPALTAYDTVSRKVTTPGYQVERQALRAASGSASALPYQDEATVVRGSGRHAKVSPGGATTSGYASSDSGLLTTFSIGQDQNDYGTLAVTDNVTESKGGTVTRHASGAVWVETACAKGPGYCWTNLGGAAVSAPSVVNADGVVWVFARFAAGVRGSARARGSAAWSSWASLGTNVTMVDAPAATSVAASQGADQVEVLATGTNGSLYTQTVSGIGTGRGTIAGKWQLLSAAAKSSVAPAVAWNEPTQRLTLTVVTRRGAVMTSGDSGDSWQRRKGVSAGQYAPAMLGDNLTDAVDVAVRGTDGRTWVLASANGGATFGAWTEVACTTSSGAKVC